MCIRDSYNAVTNVVSVTVGKGTPLVAGLPLASGIVYGESLASSTVTGAAFTNLAGAAVVLAGTNFVNPGLLPVAGTTNVAVAFTPADTADYNACLLYTSRCV